MSISGVSPATSSLLSSLSSNSSSASSSSTSSSSSSSSSNSSTSSSSSSSKLNALQQFDLEQLQSSQNSLDAYQSFSSTLVSLQNAFVGVIASSFSTALSGVTSSNSGVAYISPSASTNYAVDVTQLAQQQQVETGLTTTNTTSTPGFAANSTDVFNTGTLTIQVGNVNTTAGTFTSAGQAVTVNITDGSLQGVATAINSSGTGVTAQVVTDKNGNSQLQVSGPNTGASEGFTISGTDTGGSAQSLSTLDYGTSASTNSTNYAGSVKVAQDAQYTVNGQQYASPTNQSVPVAAGINISLLTTGSTVISQPQAPTQTINAANSLVSTLNGAFQVLGQLVGNGGALANSPAVVEEFENDLTSAIDGSYGSGTITLLSQLGITQQSAGTYTVDTNQLSAAYQQDPTAVQNVISQVSSALLQVVGNYSGQYGQVTQQIDYYQNQISIFTGQFQADQSMTSSASTQAASAVQAYNLLSLSNGGSVSPYTSEVA